MFKSIKAINCEFSLGYFFVYTFICKHFKRLFGIMVSSGVGTLHAHIFIVC